MPVLHVPLLGQLADEVHFAVHWLVAALQMLPAVLAAQSASVLQMQKLETELLIFAQVFSAEGQSLEPIHVATHVLRTG